MDQLDQIAQDLPQVNADIDAAEKLLKFLKAAGENTSQSENRLRELKLRRDRWTNALKQEGKV